MLCVPIVRLRLPYCVSSLKRRGRMAFSLPPTFLLPAVCVSSLLLSYPPACACLAAGVGRLVSCVLLLLDTHIAPSLRHEGQGDIFPVSVVLSYSFLLVDDGVGERVFVADGVMFEAKGSENPNLVAVVIQDICGLVGVNLVVPVEVHRGLLDDMTDSDTVAGHIAIADSDAVGLADENTIGFNEVKCFRESVVVVAHCSVLSAVPFRHL